MNWLIKNRKPKVSEYVPVLFLLISVCSLLLAFGADPLALNCHSKSAIDLAPTKQLQDRLITEHRGHLLLHSCRSGDVSRVKKHSDQLIQQFQHPFTLENALHVALASCPQPQLKKVVETLIKKGVAINDKNKDGISPLTVAAGRPDSLEVIEVLLKAGCNANSIDANGETRECPQIDIFGHLIEKLGSITNYNFSLFLALHHCARLDNAQGCRMVSN